jgi:hypothetical protein
VAFVMLDPNTRRRHLYVVGQTSTGKSTVAAQPNHAGPHCRPGPPVLDPHGDLAETVLLHVLRNRSNVIMPANARPSRRPVEPALKATVGGIDAR